MIRVVIDTNVLVSALLKPSGLEALVLLLCLRGTIVLYISPPILAEYQRVLYKPKLKFTPPIVEDFLRRLGTACELVHPVDTVTEAKDEPDNRFLECAQASRADFLVTGNRRHFPKTWRSTSIVNSREFLDETALLRSESF